LKRIVFSDEAKTHIRTLPHHIAMNVLATIHVKELKNKEGEKRLRVGDYRIPFSEGYPETLRIHTVKNRKDA
jgi:hypothetical protein